MDGCRAGWVRSKRWAMAVSLWVMMGPSLALAKGDVAWLAYGDFRGNIEPCGCDPRTDLGGILRLGTLVLRERTLEPGLWLFDLGNNVRSSKQDQIKNQFILEAAALLKPSAALLNHAEIAWTTLGGVKLPSLPFVLSNVAPKSTLPVSRRIELPGAVVFGYLAPRRELNGRLESFSAALQEVWRKELVGSEKATKILLYSGGDAELTAIRESKLFDVILSSNVAPEDSEPVSIEKEDPARLFRQAPNSDVISVPLGGQGVLRGGRLRGKRALSVAELVGGQECRSIGQLGPSTGCSHSVPSGAVLAGLNDFVSWLDGGYQTGSPLAELMQRYNKAVSAEFQSRSVEREQELKSSRFVGAEACQGCHQSEYQAWKASGHASALDTLRNKSKDTDSDCVGCHVVGFAEKGGFANVASSPHLAGVQCENCHGPRLEHLKNPYVKTEGPPAKGVCQSCHYLPHSSAFDYEVYWPKIKHGEKGKDQ